MSASRYFNYFDLNKVIWSEGSLLTQQHFQQWDEMIVKQQRFLWHLFEKHQWGVFELTLDEESLRTGHCRVLSCLCIFSSGEVIQYDSRRDGELVCELPINLEAPCFVFLSLPLSQTVSGLKGYPSANHNAGWTIDYRLVADRYDGAREQEIAFAIPSLTLSTKPEASSACVQLKIAALKMFSDNAYRLDTSFIPPVPQLQCSSALLLSLQRMLELLQKKLNDIEQSDKSNREYLVALFQKQIVQLKLCQDDLEKTPFTIYENFSLFFAELSGFVRDSNKNMVAYSHDDLTRVFVELEQKLIELLSALSSRNSWYFPLEKQEECLFSMSNIEVDLLLKGRCYLALRSSINDEKLPYHFIKQVKVCSQKSMKNILHSALSGVLLQHTIEMPGQFLKQIGVEYFQIKRSGHFWLEMMAERNMTVFVPSEYAVDGIELLVVPVVEKNLWK